MLSEYLSDCLEVVIGIVAIGIMAFEEPYSRPPLADLLSNCAVQVMLPTLFVNAPQ